MDVSVVASVLGTLGAVCWSIQLVPQIIVNFRRHHATGLQPSMMMLWAWAGVPLGAYNIIERFNIALRIQPQILTVLSLITWAQCHHYQKGWSASRLLLTLLPIVLVMGACQAALIIGLRLLQPRNIEWPMILMASLSAALLSAGVLRHYWDIWTHHSVRGISFIFVGIDAAGDLFSLLSVFFQPSPDIPGIVIYGSELLLWLGVLACGGYYNLLLPRIKKREHSLAQQGTSVVPRIDQVPRVGDAHDALYLQTAPSSTSVFQTATGTASDTIEGARARRVVRTVNGVEGAGTMILSDP